METENKFAVENIIDNIVILENIETGEQVFVGLDSIEGEIHDGSVLVYNDGVYKVDLDEYKKRMEVIQSKFDRVRRNK